MPEPVQAVDVSVVVPVFSNFETLSELHERIGRVLSAQGMTWELILVDDCSPDGSAAEIDRLAVDPRVTALHLAEHGGQQRAAVAGMRVSTGRMVVTIDADLQDLPEEVPTLLDRLGQASVVFSRPQGDYQSKGRLRTSRAFKPLIAAIAGTPSDYGAFIAFDRRAADGIARFETDHPYVPAMAGLLGLPVEGVPIRRAQRPRGKSAYSGWGRLRVALSALACALWWRVRGAGTAAVRDVHNQAQIDYYGRVDHGNMHPHDAGGYVENQIARALEAAGASDDAAVLEIGAGMGRYTLPMSERFSDLEVLELSPCLLAELAERAPATLLDRLHCADAAEPPQNLHARFDVVVGYFMLHHVHDVSAVLAGVSECLKPGGRAVFVEPNPRNLLYYVQIAVTPGMTWAGDRGIVRMRPALIARAVGDAGLSGFRFERFGFWPPAVRNTRAGAASERFLERLRVLRPVLPFQLFVAEKAEA